MALKQTKTSDGYYTMEVLFLTGEEGTRTPVQKIFKKRFYMRSLAALSNDAAAIWPTNKTCCPDNRFRIFGPEIPSR